MGSHLVVINSEREQEFIVKQRKERLKGKMQQFWIGLNKLTADKQWHWVDGTPYNHAMTFWATSQPDNDKNAEKCVTAGSWSDLTKWNDIHCKATENQYREQGLGPAQLRDLLTP
nr:PREDICTED: C-type lectin domain family 4 member E-like [Latimeria chalumnae]|eukprot:XP_014342561.1 PREDICTED: C-type lectin domain family 4 member E-like [Latimeria chalumnae]